MLVNVYFGYGPSILSPVFYERFWRDGNGAGARRLKVAHAILEAVLLLAGGGCPYVRFPDTGWPINVTKLRF
jgi:hypothetical protein